MESSSYDDPQSKIWSIYISEADKVDKALAASWKGDMDGILIFVRLLVKLLSYNNRDRPPGSPGPHLRFLIFLTTQCYTYN